MHTTNIDARALIATLNELEKEQFPFALATALNDTAFQDVRAGWRDTMPRVFDRPKPMTLNAALVKKATKREPIAEIFLRDQATKGTPPSRYLVHQVTGGTRRRKPFENLLTRAGVMSATEFAVPARDYPLDPFGNVPGRIITAILSDVQATRDPAAFSTAASRGRRARRKNKRGGVYFYSPGPGGHGPRGKEQTLPRGIYERIVTGFGVAVRPVFIFVSHVSYAQRFDAYGLAAELFNRNFPRRFEAAMARAVASSKRRSAARAESQAVVAAAVRLSLGGDL